MSFNFLEFSLSTDVDDSRDSEDAADWTDAARIESGERVLLCLVLPDDLPRLAPLHTFSLIDDINEKIS